MSREQEQQEEHEEQVEQEEQEEQEEEGATWQSRHFSLLEYGFVCECKRCLDQQKDSTL